MVRLPWEFTLALLVDISEWKVRDHLEVRLLATQKERVHLQLLKPIQAVLKHNLNSILITIETQKRTKEGRLKRARIFLSFTNLLKDVSPMSFSELTSMLTTVMGAVVTALFHNLEEYLATYLLKEMIMARNLARVAVTCMVAWVE